MSVAVATTATTTTMVTTNERLKSLKIGQMINTHVPKAIAHGCDEMRLSDAMTYDTRSHRTERMTARSDYCAWDASGCQEERKMGRIVLYSSRLYLCICGRGCVSRCMCVCVHDYEERCENSAIVASGVVCRWPLPLVNTQHYTHSGWQNKSWNIDDWRRTNAFQSRMLYKYRISSRWCKFVRKLNWWWCFSLIHVKINKRNKQTKKWRKINDFFL